MIYTGNTKICNHEVNERKEISKTRLLLMILLGSFVFETIGFIQFFLIFGNLEEFSQEFIISTLPTFPIFLLFGFPLFTYLRCYPMQFWLIFEIPWILILAIFHKRREYLSNGKINIISICIIGLAVFPILLIQFFGVPKIPYLSDTISVIISQYEHSQWSFISPSQFLQLYWIFFIWIISWIYLEVIVSTCKSSFSKNVDSKHILRIWTLWIVILTLFLCIGPTYWFTTLKILG